jgi:hypothetical protein
MKLQWENAPHERCNRNTFGHPPRRIPNPASYIKNRPDKSFPAIFK